MATHYEYHGAWYIQWTENGQRKKQNLGRSDVVTEREAKLAAKAKEVELATGKIIIPQGVVLRDFATEYLDWHEKEFPHSNTRIRQIFDDHLIPEFGHFPLDQINTRPVELYKQRRNREAKTGTVTKELRTLRACLNRAVHWELIDKLPFRVKDPKRLDSKPPIFFTQDQMAKIYDVDAGHRHIWQLLANTGMRRSEAMNLRERDVHDTFIRVTSSEEQRTKSGKYRDIPLSKGAKKALEALGGGAGYVLPRVAKTSLSRAAAKAIKRAKLEGSIHTFRHTYCSHLVMAGVPLRTVQQLAGHANYKTTEIYTHLLKDHVLEAGVKINL